MTPGFSCSFMAWTKLDGMGRLVPVDGAGLLEKYVLFRASVVSILCNRFKMSGFKDDLPKTNLERTQCDKILQQLQQVIAGSCEDVPERSPWVVLELYIVW